MPRFLSKQQVEEYREQVNRNWAEILYHGARSKRAY